MIHCTNDFFNKAAKEIRNTYFPNENHGTTQNINYQTVTNTLELFNNGCLTYRQLIGRLSKDCNDTTEKLHTIIKNYVVSFGSYEYKPSKN